jgi:restriction system protein
MFKGWIGELKTEFSLWAGLDSNLYHRFHDVIIPSNHGTTQVDHILVSPFGLFVVETKNYKGWIYGSADQSTWTQVIYKSKHKFQNPLRQTHRHKKILSKYLGVSESTIQPVVSFVGDVRFKTELPSNVLRSGLSSYIKQFKEVVFSDDEIERITGLLSNVKSESKISKSEHIQSLKERHSSTTICPKCGSELVMREVKQGARKGSQFLGCSGYPKCRFTRDIKQETGGSWTFTIIVTLIVIGIIWWVLN